MSNAQFPDLPGRLWDIGKSPRFNTKTLTSVNMTEYRAAFSASPIYHFGFSYDVLRDGAQPDGVTYDELRELMGFYMQRLGRWDSFLYDDPGDNATTNSVFGMGDGNTPTFKLARTLGGFSERVANINDILNVSVANTPTTAYDVDTLGVVTFETPPAANAVLTWSGTYYYRCRFSNDNLDFTQFMPKMWALQMLEFDGCLGTKI